MNAKQFLLTILSVFFILPIHSQSVENSTEYRKFYLSLNAGLIFPSGTSNTVLSEDFTLPFAKRLFVPGLDGAWFFTKNYGIGIKYRLSKKKITEESCFEYTEQTYDQPLYEDTKISFKETSHFAGPAFFARWSLGESRWMIVANAGIGYFHDKLSNIDLKDDYQLPPGVFLHSTDGYDYDDQGNRYPQSKHMGVDDLTGTSIGFSLSAGIHYRITPLIGAGLNANGFFASISRMKYQDDLTGKYETTEISRNITQAGLSASIDFSF